MPDDELWPRVSCAVSWRSSLACHSHRRPRSDPPCRSTLNRYLFYAIVRPCDHLLAANITHNASIAAEALAILTSLSCPPASCHNPFSTRGISSAPPTTALSGRRGVFGAIAVDDSWGASCRLVVGSSCCLGSQALQTSQYGKQFFIRGLTSYHAIAQPESIQSAKFPLWVVLNPHGVGMKDEERIAPGIGPTMVVAATPRLSFGTASRDPSERSGTVNRLPGRAVRPSRTLCLRQATGPPSKEAPPIDTSHFSTATLARFKRPSFFSCQKPLLMLDRL